MKVWPVFMADYDADLCGLYSTPELAAAAVRMYGTATTLTWGGDKAFVGEPIEIDASAPFVQSGVIRWRVGFEANGTLSTLRYMQGPGTGELTATHPDSDAGVWVECDAKTEVEAIEIASAARITFLEAHG